MINDNTNKQKWDVATRIRELRKSFGYTHAEMARVAGVSMNSWQQYEAGSKTPGGRVFEALAKAGINTNWLFTGQGEMRTSTPAAMTLASGLPLDGPLLAECIHQIDRTLGFSSYLNDSEHMRRGPLLSSRDMGHFAVEFYARSRAIFSIREQDEIVRCCAEHLHLLVYGRLPFRRLDSAQRERLLPLDFPDMQDASVVTLAPAAQRVFQLLEELALVQWDRIWTGGLQQLLLSRQGMHPEAPPDDFAAFRWNTIRAQRLRLVRSGLVAFIPGQDFAQSMDVDRCTADLLEFVRLEISIIVERDVLTIRDFAVRRGEAIPEWFLTTFPSPITTQVLLTIAKVFSRGLEALDKYSGTSYARDSGIEAFLTRFSEVGDKSPEQAADELQRLLLAVFEAMRRDLRPSGGQTAPPQGKGGES